MVSFIVFVDLFKISFNKEGEEEKEKHYMESKKNFILIYNDKTIIDMPIDILLNLEEREREREREMLSPFCNVGSVVMVMVFNATFSVILWWSVLLMEETGVPGENY